MLGRSRYLVDVSCNNMIKNYLERLSTLLAKTVQKRDSPDYGIL